MIKVVACLMIRTPHVYLLAGTIQMMNQSISLRILNHPTL